MEFYRDESWTLSKLNNHNVDTWMWFERMCCVLQQKASVYDTDVFLPAIEKLENLTWIKYSEQSRRFRIIVDHIRTAFMLINDWLIPSNVWAWYVLRMIVRRFYYNLILLKKLNINEVDKFLDEFDSKIGLEKIKCVHVNDSKNEFNSHKRKKRNYNTMYMANTFASEAVRAANSYSAGGGGFSSGGGGGGGFGGGISGGR